MPSRYSQFLAHCLTGDHVQLRAALAGPGWNWTDLFAAAAGEALLPALHSRFSALNLLESLPAEIADFLAVVESVNRERNAVIVDELNHAVHLLNEVGIEPVLLKGAAYLAAGVYPDPATRYLCDIDLLIPESQLPAAVAALTNNEYICDGRDIFGPFRHHHPPLNRPGRPSLELHHSLSLGKSARLLPAAEVIAQSSPFRLPTPVEGRHDLVGQTPVCQGPRISPQVRIPPPEHLATHLIIHSQIHHSYDQRIWPGLRAMWDLVTLDKHYGSRLNWLGIERRFDAAGEHASLVLHLMQIGATLGRFPAVAISPDALTRLRWTRRKLLRRLPPMRYLDPIYMLSTVLNRRFLVLRNMLATRAGWKHLIYRIAEPQIYVRLLTDVVEGRGR